jgi:uncharacterized NAD(P)/FAD-binding protein YdhS
MSRSSTPLQIGIVGAGASGTAALYEIFARFAGAPPQIVLIDGGDAHGAGNIYQADLDCALVNTQAKYMSIIYDDQDDFVDWAADYERSLGNSGGARQYYTRSVFGKYLRQRHEEIIRRYRAAGSPIEFVASYVEGFEAFDNKVFVKLGEDFVAFDYLILCTGHGRQHRPASRPGELLDPYPLRDLVAATDSCRRIAVLGAGLTAIDCALGLLSHDRDNQVTMFSRTGILPDIRADFAENLELTVAERPHHKGATLEELMNRFRAELAAHAVSSFDLRCYLDRLRRGVESFVENSPIAETDRKIQNLAISLGNRDLSTYWHGFGASDRNAFCDRYYRLLHAICGPIPPITAAALRDAIATGRLQVKLGTAQPHAGRWTVGGKAFDAVVDGTGKATSRSQERFEALLVSRGCAIREDYGGIRVERNSRNIVLPDRKRSRLYAVGHVTRGSLLFSSSLYQATRSVKHVVESIVSVANSQVGTPS